MRRCHGECQRYADAPDREEAPRPCPHSSWMQACCLTDGPGPGAISGGAPSGAGHGPQDLQEDLGVVEGPVNWSAPGPSADNGMSEAVWPAIVWGSDEVSPRQPWSEVQERSPFSITPGAKKPGTVSPSTLLLSLSSSTPSRDLFAIATVRLITSPSSTERVSAANAAGRCMRFESQFS